MLPEVGDVRRDLCLLALCAYGQKIAALVGAGGLSVVVGQVVVIELVARALVRKLSLR